jgi:hypothetical protein
MENISVLNQAAGGNCVTMNCLGPALQDRFDRDTLEPLGVKWVIILEGINDLGNNGGLQVSSLTGAFSTRADKAHAAGL